jgi:hypothetical protein
VKPRRAKCPRLQQPPDREPGDGWLNRPTCALVCWLHAYRYIYLMGVSLACWKAAENASDRSGQAR